MESSKLNVNLVSLFSGAGGLDKGFELASDDRVKFDTVWANEYDKSIHETYEKAFPHALLVKKSITQVGPEDLVTSDGRSLIGFKGVGQVLGLLGGPPCQSWSAAGSKRGKEDKRGQLFWDYIRILETTKPAFFVAENVPGILAQRNAEALAEILEDFRLAGYNVNYAKLNAAFHDVPEDRERVIFVGFRSDIDLRGGFSFPVPAKRGSDGRAQKMTLEDVPGLRDLDLTAVSFDRENREPNQNEFLEGSFSPLYMSRNRCRTWAEPSFTIQATARHIPIHPNHGHMVKAAEDKFEFSKELSARRLTVRECATIQTFPMDFPFTYKNIIDGYKMVGNAVPVNLARAVAREIAKVLTRAEVGETPTELDAGVQALRVEPYL